MTHPTGYFTHDSVLRPNPMEEAPDTPERIDAIESRMMVLGLDDLVERFECGPANDDYLRLVPIVSVYAMKAAGVDSQSSWKRLVVNTAASFAIDVAVTYGLKYSIKSTRPDGTDNA